MKYRIGHVSNSSSSSFLILSKEPLTEEMLMPFFCEGMDKAAFLYPFAATCAKTLVAASSLLRTSLICEWTHSDRTVAEVKKELNRYFPGALEREAEGWHVYDGSVSDEYSELGAEAFLCEQDIDFENETLYISKKGGY